MSRLLILGAGQYGFVAKEIAEAMGIFSRIEFLDDHSEMAIGKLDELDRMLGGDKAEFDEVFVAIGNLDMREKWMNKIENLATLIHPRAMISPSAMIGLGCAIEGGAVISTGVNIGTGTIVMANVVVGHNASVGKYCQLKYNCTITENYFVADKTKVDCNVVCY